MIRISPIFLVLIAAFFLITFATMETQAAASFTFEIHPRQPIAGEPAEYMLYTWATAKDGEADTSSPFDMSGYPFDVRMYTAQEFPGPYAPEHRGVSIELVQTELNVWRGPVVFPHPGEWVIVIRNAYPPLVLQPTPREAAVLDVTVIEPTGPESAIYLGMALLLVLAGGLLVGRWRRWALHSC